MTMYQTNPYGISIIEVEVIRTTDKMVFFAHNGKERRASREHYHETREMARCEIIARLQTEISDYVKKMDFYRSAIARNYKSIETLQNS